MKEAVKFYKHDWKKVSRKIFRETQRKYRPAILSKIFNEIKETTVAPKENLKFTHEEDVLLIECVNKHGLKWCLI